MHECVSESAFLANAEVDSMRGVIDSGLGHDIKTFPCQGEIEQVQEDIRLEIDCREERLRELEFLEKGGDPLDFNFGNTISVSVQSTSLTDQHPEQVVTSKIKDRCLLTVLRSQHEEPVESFSKPEANSGDNLLLFDGETKLLTDRKSKSHTYKKNLAPSELSLQTEGTHKAKGSENSAVFRPYARRNRSKSTRESARLVSMDSNLHPSSTLQSGTRYAEDLLTEANSKDLKLSTIFNLKSLCRISDEAQHNDSTFNVESVGSPKKDKLANALHLGQKQHAIDAETNGPLFGSEKDQCENRDVTSCIAGNRGSLHSDVIASQATGMACQTDDLEPSSKMHCTQNDVESHYPEITLVSLGVEPLKDDQMNEDPNETRGHPVSVSGEASKVVIEDPLKIKIEPTPVDPGSVVIGGNYTYHGNNSSSAIIVEDEDLKNKLMTPELSSAIKPSEPEGLDAHKTAGVQTSTKVPLDEASEAGLSGRDENGKDVPDPEGCKKIFTDKMDEDSILAEAKIIQAKWKGIADISMRSLPFEGFQKSHWDFILEEMAWSANDFLQERLWKTTAAAQISRQAAISSHLRDQKQMPVRRLKFVAHSLAKAVMEFWRASELVVSYSSNSTCGITAPGGSSSLEPQSPCKTFALKTYAINFLKYNSSMVPSFEAEEPSSNDMHDLGIHEMSGGSCVTEDDLFYAIPHGAMERYRTSIESYVSQCEKNGSMQKTSYSTRHTNDSEEISEENCCDDDDGETSTQYLPGTVEWSKASKFPHKKQKGMKRAYPSGSYDLGLDLAYGSRSSGTQKSVMVKRTASRNGVSIPTKRMRTASRQRVLGLSSDVGTVNTLAMNKTDASSEDTNSYQDDWSSFHGGSQMQRSLEVESPVDFGNYLPGDFRDVSTKTKKKKAKNMNSSYEERWLHESAILDDIGDHSKRRLDNHHLDSNRSNGLFGQYRNKKLKVSMQKSENVLDYGAPATGSMPSPVASQMSNMPNMNEYKKVIVNRDRFRQSKVSKLTIPLPESGNAWTSFEEQALVVLVHDMGPNWELVSDVINSTLRCKRIFRWPRECKEKHKLLMDQTADGADSADDSGSSQPYPSTMPGIPKGSARQLFERLHGPLEQDTVKSHFEKIIMIGHKKHHRKKQCDSHDHRHVTPHNSHMIAVSLVLPNNLNGVCLTPLDHINSITSTTEVLPLGYQTSQTTDFTNQSCVPSVLPPSGANSIFQGPVGNNLSSPSGPLSHKNGRYSVPGTSLPLDDHQRIQPPNPKFTGRSIQQSTMSPGPHPLPDRFGPCKLQGGNGMGMMHGINSRGLPMSRPGFHGLNSSAMMDSAAAPAVVSSQGNSMQRPMDSSQHIRPRQSLEHRQMMAPELQIRATQANNHCITPINGLNASVSSQAGPSSAPSYPVHPQQKHQMSLLQQSHDLTNPHQAHVRAPNHAIGSQHPAFGRLVKERQLQQQQVLQNQKQYSASKPIMSQTQRHLHTPMQNSSQVQPQSSQAVSHSPLLPSSPMTPTYSQLQQKHHLPPHGLLRDSHSTVSNLPSQVLMQRQRHPQQLQSQQHGKQPKVEGKGNMVVSQNVITDRPSPVVQSTDKVEQDASVDGSQNSV